VSVIVASTLLVSAEPAQAAAGDPFPAADPLVFVAQQTPTRLYRATTNAAGDVQFTAEGGASGVTYNAISYRQADNYLYGMVTVASTGFPVGSLVRIGQGGTVTRVGTNTFTAPDANGLNNGVFGPDGYLYATSNAAAGMQVINTATGTLVRTVTLSQTVTTSDLTLAGGYFWGVRNSDVTIPPVYVRVNPSTGAVTTYATTLPAGVYGAAWTFGNGNIGLSNNATGTVSQISIANPASATPTFTIVASSNGPSSTTNDGAGSTGLPTDLSIVKTGPAALVPGGSATYTLTVTNNGAGNSSGYVVNDTVPAPLTNVASTNAGCTVTGRNVRCMGGRLLAGASVTYTVTASVPSNVTAGIINTATVTANETDPVPGNNTSTTTAGIPGLSILKHAGSPVDVNGNGITDAGDTIQYTFDVTNTGTVSMTTLVVNDNLVGHVTCPSTTLAAKAAQTCTADIPYTISTADQTTAAVNNSATVTGKTPDGNNVTSTPSTTTTPVVAAAPGISLIKSVVPANFTNYQVGDTVNYSFLVSNTGNVPLIDATVAEVDFTGSGDMTEPVCPAAMARIPVAGQVTCTASYVATQADVNAGLITNTATASGTPPGGFVVTSNPSSAEVTTTANAALTLAKSASPSWISTAGASVAYSFVVTNTGNVTLTDVAVNETVFSGTGTPPVVTCPTGAESLAPGDTITCVASYVATQSDVDARTIGNTAVAVGAQPDGTEAASDPSSAKVSVFVVTLPLTGGTSTDQVLILGGSGVLLAILMAIWHHRHTRRRRGDI
jgi:uncharacterized repeat protein (TIGR01451 family)